MTRSARLDTDKTARPLSAIVARVPEAQGQARGVTINPVSYEYQKVNYMRAYSPRNFQLSSWVTDKPTLAVELYEKWYELFLINPDGSVVPVAFPEGSIDHAPYPDDVERLAGHRGWHLDEVTIELITGRWVRAHGTSALE